MLLVFRYLRVSPHKQGHSLEKLRSHFSQLKKKFSIVLPGDFLPRGKLSVCLTFDGATFDFYHYMFPLLKELQIRALLGVPVRYILDSTTLPPQERLSVPPTFAMQDGFFETKAPFCTFDELGEMVESGLVEVASHSYAHCNLSFSFVDLQKEVVHSKEILEEKLPQPISSFVYPFGRANLALQEYISQTYPYAFGMGSALNWGWGNGKKPLSRINGDGMSHPSAPFSPLQLAKYFGKALIS